LDSRGLSHREIGDLGPVYGFQWRHFGAKYEDMHTDYTGKGVDQLKMCIDKIKNNPEDRRIVMSAWNPVDLNEMALPPCHMFCQFYVRRGRIVQSLPFCYLFGLDLIPRRLYRALDRLILLIRNCRARCTNAVLTWDWAYRSTLHRMLY